MARPQEFDTDAVIDGAMHVFWELGLHRASVDDLLGSIQLSRSSLYNAFGGKQQLFEAAVNRYVEIQAEKLRAMLDSLPMQKGIAKLFHAAVNDNYEGKGCLLVNCAGSLICGDGDEQPVLRNAFAKMFSVVEQRIRSAQREGEVSQACQPAEMATLICSTLSGLRIFQKASIPKSRLKKTADLAVQTVMQQLA